MIWDRGLNFLYDWEIFLNHTTVPNSWGHVYTITHINTYYTCLMLIITYNNMQGFLSISYIFIFILFTVYVTILITVIQKIILNSINAITFNFYVHYSYHEKQITFIGDTCTHVRTLPLLMALMRCIYIQKCVMIRSTWLYKRRSKVHWWLSFITLTSDLGQESL